MTGKRKRYTAEFKAKVALEALRGELTAAQLAAKHGIHQTMVGEWKRQAMEGLTAVFSVRSAAQESAKAAERPCWRSSGAPWRSGPDDGVEHAEEASHAGDDGDHFRPAARGELPVVRLDGRVPADG